MSQFLAGIAYVMALLFPTPTPVAHTVPATTQPPVTTPVVTTPVLSPPTDLYEAWSKVAVCEEGGWNGSSGYNYPDSLGINRTNWYAFGGGSDVSPSAQIAVAERLIQTYGVSIPDQNGCGGGW